MQVHNQWDLRGSEDTKRSVIESFGKYYLVISKCHKLNCASSTFSEKKSIRHETRFSNMKPSFNNFEQGYKFNHTIVPDHKTNGFCLVEETIPQTERITNLHSYCKQFFRKNRFSMVDHIGEVTTSSTTQH